MALCSGAAIFGARRGANSATGRVGCPCIVLCGTHSRAGTLFSRHAKPNPRTALALCTTLWRRPPLGRLRSCCVSIRCAAALPDDDAATAWVVPVQAGIFWVFGLYRGIWRYASARSEAHRVCGSGGSARPARAVRDAANRRAAIGADFRSGAAGDDHGGSRFAYRIMKEQSFNVITQGDANR